MKVVFRGEPDDQIAIKGTLEISQDSDIGQYIGCELRFTTQPPLTDTSLRWEGIVAKAGSQSYYEFQKLEWDENTGSGRLKILSPVES